MPGGQLAPASGEPEKHISPATCWHTGTTQIWPDAHPEAPHGLVVVLVVEVVDVVVVDDVVDVVVVHDVVDVVIVSLDDVVEPIVVEPGASMLEEQPRRRAKSNVASS